MDGKIEGNLEILPKFLSSVPHWFERYVDEDVEIVSLLHREILNASPELDAPKSEDLYPWPFEEYK